MAKLMSAKYDSFGVLIATFDEIEAFAYHQLSEYKKGYFKEPHPLDVDDFVENYLGIKVGYYGLSKDKSVYGVTALSNGLLPIIDSAGEVSCREIEKGQVFVDCEACGNRETTIRFTLLHESGHFQFDVNVDLNRSDIHCCLTDTYLEIFGQKPGRAKKSPREWMEAHANKYATCLLMPRRFVRQLWAKHRKAYFEGKRITSSRPKRLWKVICAIAEDLCVAQTSIAYRLLEVNLISKEMFDSLDLNKWEEKK